MFLSSQISITNGAQKYINKCKSATAFAKASAVKVRASTFAKASVDEETAEEVLK
jgi:hypothetical protein